MWANILRNPWFLLDVRLAPELTSHMSVVAQLLLDAASLTAWKPNARTSASRLLFSKELPPLKKRVKDLFNHLSPTPSAAGSNEADYCSEQELFAYTTELLSVRKPSRFLRSAKKWVERLIRVMYKLLVE